MEPVKNRTKFTVEEYFAYDDALVDGKAEYDNGEIWDMAGGSYVHGVIPGNLATEIGSAIKNKGCSVFTGDVKIGIAETSSYLYPDLGVLCGEPRFSEVREDILVNPLLLVEVLSDSTSIRDRGTKLDRYRMIPSLKEILLVEQKAPQIEVYFRNEVGRWESDLYIGLQQVVTLRSIDITIAMEEIYRLVKFPEETPINPPKSLL